MSVSDLKFKSFKAKAGTVKAVLLTEDAQVPTAGGVQTANAGQYVAVIGEGEVEHHGPFPGEKDGDPPVFETRKVKSPLYGIFTSDEFEFLYIVGKAEPETTAGA